MTQQTSMEERSPVLLIALLFYFAMGPITLVSFAVQLLRGVSPNFLGVVVALFASASTFAAWRHRRWGYFGVVLLGVGLLIRNALHAHSQSWQSTPANLSTLLCAALLAPILLHHRLYTARAPSAAA